MGGNSGQGFLTCRKSATWDRSFYFPSEGRRAEDFLSHFKNPTASAGFEPPNLGIRGQHATSAPPKPLYLDFLNGALISGVLRLKLAHFLRFSFVLHVLPTSYYTKVINSTFFLN
jgi:hypothetical protein